MKIKRFENDSLVTYEFSSLDDLKNKIEEWKKEFREVNATGKVIKFLGSDLAYEMYCKDLNDLINRYAEG